MLAERVAQVCIPGDATIVQALAAIDRGGASIALVVAADERLLGTLTDGDIRRALLGGATLADGAGAFARPDAVTVGPEAERADVLDLMQARGISQVPVLDAGGRVTGLHLMKELIGEIELPNPAVVMAGGLGTRLRPDTLAVPKPMIEVAGRPILERIVLHLVGGGIRDIWLAVNYKSEVIEAHFGDGSGYGAKIHYLREDPGRPLGTGGALALLPGSAREARGILVMNGDLITRFSIAELISGHDERADIVTIGVTRYSHQVPFGVVDVDGDRVTVVEEKPQVSWLVNAGIYVVEPAALDLVEPGVDFPITELVTRSIARGQRVGAHVLDDPWQDVGRPADLREARGQAG